MPLTRGQKYALYSLLAHTDGGPKSKSHLRLEIEKAPPAGRRKALQDYAVKLDSNIDPDDIGEFDLNNVESMRAVFGRIEEFPGPAWPDEAFGKQLYDAIKKI